MKELIFGLIYILLMQHLEGFTELSLRAYKYRKFLKIKGVNSMVFQIRSSVRSYAGLFDDQELVYEFQIEPNKVRIGDCVNVCPGTVVNINTNLNDINPTTYWIQWYEGGAGIGLGEIVEVNTLATRNDPRIGLRFVYMAFSGPKGNLTLTSHSGYSCEDGLTISTPHEDLRYAKSLLHCADYSKQKKHASGFLYSKYDGSCSYIKKIFDNSDVSFSFNIVSNSLWKLCFHSSL